MFQSFSPVAGIGEAIRERVSASVLTHSSSLCSGMVGGLERRRKTYSVSFSVFRALSSLRVVSHWPSLLGDAMQWLDADQCVGAGLFWLNFFDRGTMGSSGSRMAPLWFDQGMYFGGIVMSRSQVTSGCGLWGSSLRSFGIDSRRMKQGLFPRAEAVCFAMISASCSWPNWWMQITCRWTVFVGVGDLGLVVRCRRSLCFPISF